MGEALQISLAQSFEDALIYFYRKAYLKSYPIFLRAAIRGHTAAKKMTGFSCELGLGTPKSIPDAIQYALVVFTLTELVGTLMQVRTEMVMH